MCKKKKKGTTMFHQRQKQWVGHFHPGKIKLVWSFQLGKRCSDPCPKDGTGLAGLVTPATFLPIFALRKPLHAQHPCLEMPPPRACVGLQASLTLEGLEKSSALRNFSVRNRTGGRWRLSQLWLQTTAVEEASKYCVYLPWHQNYGIGGSIKCFSNVL